MITKVMDEQRVTHYRVVGLIGNYVLCSVGPAHGVRPTSRKRNVDCMTCLALFSTMETCEHASGNYVSAAFTADGFDGTTRRCPSCAAMAAT